MKTKKELYNAKWVSRRLRNIAKEFPKLVKYAPDEYKSLLAKIVSDLEMTAAQLDADIMKWENETTA